MNVNDTGSHQFGKFKYLCMCIILFVCICACVCMCVHVCTCASPCPMSSTMYLTTSISLHAYQHQLKPTTHHVHQQCSILCFTIFIPQHTWAHVQPRCTDAVCKCTTQGAFACCWWSPQEHRCHMWNTVVEGGVGEVWRGCGWVWSEAGA